MKLYKKLPTTAISIGLLSLSLSAHAEIHWSGFSTLATGIMTDKDDTYAGYEGNDLNWRQDSKVGLQASTELQDGLAFTVQLLASGKDDFDPEIKWLYMGYEINDELSLKLGRMRAPIYNYSDYIDVGYAYHWIRPPVETYNISFDTAEGVGLFYNTQLGDIDSGLSFLYGRIDDEVTVLGETLPIEINNLFVASWDLAYDNFTARLAYAAAYDLTLESSSLNALADALTASGYASTADNLLADGDDAYFASLALGYDNGEQFVLAEGTYQDSGDNLFHTVKSWYISSGFRVAAMTYHLTVANAETEKPESLLDGVDSGAAIYNPLNSLVQSRDGETTSWTLGMRYDFHPSAALKVEYSNVDDHDTANAVGDGNLFAASVDLVF